MTQPAADSRNNDEHDLVELMTYADVMYTLNASRRFVERLVVRGELKAIRFSARMVRFNPRDVQAYIQRIERGLVSSPID